uniref:PH domain-containing protein n=1 Tax=Steinernema glaseri TaxID=37863 RepID=A0A1I8ATN0_9BILA
MGHPENCLEKCILDIDVFSSGDVVKFYDYPDDDGVKEPRAYMDLAKVANERILRATPEVCPRPNTFFVDIYINTSSYSVEKPSYVLKRVLLSADTSELCEAWMEMLNKTVRAVRRRVI